MLYFRPNIVLRKWNKLIFNSDEINKNAFELLRAKISSMDSDTQQTLKIASCLGSPFSLLNLMIIKDCRAGIENALSKGFITQLQGSKNVYQFSHDQVQQAGKKRAFSALLKPELIYLLKHFL